jgi:lysophospholipase L1-like esterase
MVGHRAGLSKALSEWFARRGGLVRADAWNGVGIDTYAKSGRIVSLVAANKPDLVFISLGTNDSAVPHPEALRRAIERIVHDIGKRPCVWLAPPVPKRDTGVTDVLRWAVAPCMFLPARGDAYERIADGLHLSNEGGRQWATDIVTALFERPADGGRRGSP